jgi:hypothetical protein
MALSKREREVLEPLVQRLRQVQQAAGNPGVRALQRHGTVSKSVISANLSLQAEPTWPFIHNFLDACESIAGHRLADRADWATFYRTIQDQLAELRSRAGDGPAQLPSVVPHFTGRADGLKAIDALVSRRHRVPILVLHGIAGVGKTSLGVAWAQSRKDRFADGQLYVDLRGYDPQAAPVEPFEVLYDMLVALGEDPAKVPRTLGGRTGQLGTLTKDRSVLIFLDNALNEEQVRPLLTGSPDCRVLITSRSPLDGLHRLEGAARLELAPLGDSEAADLLRRQVGRRWEDNGARRVIQLCGGLPLALRIAGSWVEDHGLSPAAAADELAANLGGPGGADPRADIKEVFAWSYRRLGADDARRFRLLALHPGPQISGPAVGALFEVPPDEASGLLDELVGLSLVAEPRPGRYWFHDLLRRYAIELADDETVEPTRRLVDHYLWSVAAANTAWDPMRKIPALGEPPGHVRPESFRDPDVAQAWLHLEYPVLLRIIDRAIATGATRPAWQIAWGLADFMNRQGHWADGELVLRTVLEATEAAGDLLGQAYLHRCLGRGGDVTEDAVAARTHLGSALDLLTTLGDVAGQANTHLDLTVVSVRVEEWESALRHSQDAVAAFEACGDVVSRANAMNAVSYALAKLGRVEEGLTICEYAVELLDQLDDAAGLGAALDTAGLLYGKLGRREDAERAYLRAIELFRDNGDPFMQADTLEHLGELYRTIPGRDADATLAEAAELFERAGSPARADRIRK